MDVFLQLHALLAQAPILRVSILVLVDVFLQLDGGEEGAKTLLVSILVLVDVFLQQPGTRIYYTGDMGFNPCFSGCLSSTP